MKTIKTSPRLRSLLAGGALALLLAASPHAARALNAGDVILSGSAWLDGHGVTIYWNAGATTCWGSSYTYGYYTGCQWQCVELAQRLYTTLYWHMGSFGCSWAYQIYDQAGANGMTAYPNGGGYVPVPGDMVIWAANSNGSGPGGHVAVVDWIDVGHVYVCEQNGSTSGRVTLNRSGLNGSSLVRADGWGTIRGCVHSPNNPYNSHSQVAVVQNADGRCEIFIIGQTGPLYHSYQTSINGTWSSWSSLGGTWVGNSVPAVGLNNNGCLEVFLVGTTGQMYHNWQTSPGGSWNGWASLGGSLSPRTAVAVGKNANGWRYVYVVGRDGQLYYNYFNGSSWVGWGNLGGIWAQTGMIATGNDQDGRQEVMLIGNDGHLYTKFQTSINGPWSSSWTSLGGGFPQNARIALNNSGGRLEAFIINGDNGPLYHSWQTAPNGTWSGWSSLGGNWAWDAQPVVCNEQNGTGWNVLLIGRTGNIYNNYYNGSSWSGWNNLGGSFNQNVHPALLPNQDGRLEVYVIPGAGQDVHTAFESAPNAQNSWNGWYSLGGNWY